LSAILTHQPGLDEADFPRRQPCCTPLLIVIHAMPAVKPAAAAPVPMTALTQLIEPSRLRWETMLRAMRRREITGKGRHVSLAALTRACLA